MAFQSFNSKYYVQSRDIKVFPCSYRGYTKTGDSESIVFDPEARSTTESNFTNTFQKLSNTKQSYVVSWDDTAGAEVLKCVIGGYYFEIYDHTVSDFFLPNLDLSKNNSKSSYLCINATDAEVATNTTQDRERKTKILTTFTGSENDNYLDIKIGSAATDPYVFTGLIIDNSSQGSSQFCPFICTYGRIGAIGDGQTQINTNGSLFYKDNEDYKTIELKHIEAGSDELLSDGTAVYTREYKVNPEVRLITDVLDTDTGNYAIRMRNEGGDTTVASGEYAIALGKKTKAAGEYGVAFGVNTEANGNGAFAAGNTTKSNGENSVTFGSNTIAGHKDSTALGNNTETAADNQVVIGKYNTKDATQAFIIGNGTSTIPKNIFTVSHVGNTDAQGSLTIKGNITANKVGNNDLTLGSTTEASCGSITVYGTAQDKLVFTVNSAGDTTIAGSTSIAKDTESTNSTSGALTVAGGVGIAKQLNVNGVTTLGNTLTVEGQSTLKNNLIVATGNATTLGGTLSVTGATSLAANLTVAEDAQFNNNVTAVGNINVVGSANDGTTATNTLTLGSATANVSGALDIYGAGESKVFSVENTGNATISGAATVNGTAAFNSTVAITDKTDASSVETGALKVTGGVGIGQKLYVGNDTLIGGNVSFSKDLSLTGGTAIHNLTVGHKDPDVAADKSAGTLKVYTTAGNVGFKVDENGESSIYNRLTINSETAASGDIRLRVGGNTTITGTLTAKALNLTDIGSITDGDLKATNIEAANELKAKKLVLKDTSGNEFVKLEDSTCQLRATQLLLTSTDESKATTIDGRFTSTGYTTLADTVTIDTDGNISEVKELIATGKIQATKFNAQSDIRQKTNIKDYKCDKSILELPIKSFEYISDDSHSTYIGCLAQDLQTICPEIVDTDTEGFLSIQETKLIYLLLQEVKELKTRLEKLEGR